MLMIGVRLPSAEDSNDGKRSELRIISNLDGKQDDECVNPTGAWEAEIEITD